MTDLPSQPLAKAHERVRFGAVAVLARGEQLLVIWRSRWVIAPRAFCFPVARIEGDETEPEALVRETQEELGLA